MLMRARGVGHQRFGLAAVSVINDFEAVGYGVLQLQPGQLHTLNDAPVQCARPASPFHPPATDVLALLCSVRRCLGPAECIACG